MERYFTYKNYLTRTYGNPVYRVGVDAGFSCPNRDKQRRGGCIYCDAYGSTAAYQRTRESATAGLSAVRELKDPCVPVAWEKRLEHITAQVDRGITFLARRYRASRFMLYLQAFSNTYAPMDELQALYRHALSLHPFCGFIISTRPDCVDPEIARFISSFRNQVDEVWVELGLQSAHDATLAFLNRRHTVYDVANASHLLRDEGIRMTFHVMLGLPGEGEKERAQTEEFIQRIHPDGLKIHNLHIPLGTPLLEAYKSGEYAVPGTSTHVEHTAKMLSHIPGDVVIQRLVCDTPRHRLTVPRNFAAKGAFLIELRRYLEYHDIWQGKSLGWARDQVGKGRAGV